MIVFTSVPSLVGQMTYKCDKQLSAASYVLYFLYKLINVMDADLFMLGESSLPFQYLGGTSNWHSLRGVHAIMLAQGQYLNVSIVYIAYH